MIAQKKWEWDEGFAFCHHQKWQFFSEAKSARRAVCGWPFTVTV